MSLLQTLYPFAQKFSFHNSHKNCYNKWHKLKNTQYNSHKFKYIFKIVFIHILLCTYIFPSANESSWSIPTVGRTAPNSDNPKYTKRPIQATIKPSNLSYPPHRSPSSPPTTYTISPTTQQCNIFTHFWLFPPPPHQDLSFQSPISAPPTHHPAASIYLSNFLLNPDRFVHTRPADISSPAKQQMRCRTNPYTALKCISQFIDRFYHSSLTLNCSSLSVCH